MRWPVLFISALLASALTHSKSLRSSSVDTTVIVLGNPIPVILSNLSRTSTLMSTACLSCFFRSSGPYPISVERGVTRSKCEKYYRACCTPLPSNAKSFRAGRQKCLRCSIQALHQEALPTSATVSGRNQEFEQAQSNKDRIKPTQTGRYRTGVVWKLEDFELPSPPCRGLRQHPQFQVSISFAITNRSYRGNGNET